MHFRSWNTRTLMNPASPRSAFVNTYRLGFPTKRRSICCFTRRVHRNTAQTSGQPRSVMLFRVDEKSRRADTRAILSRGVGWSRRRTTTTAHVQSRKRARNDAAAQLDLRVVKRYSGVTSRSTNDAHTIYFICRGLGGILSGARHPPQLTVGSSIASAPSSVGAARP